MADVDRTKCADLTSDHSVVAASCGHPSSLPHPTRSCSTASPHWPCRKEPPMTGIRVSTVTAYTAHREWASRPPDERYASVQALYEAARTRRARIEERTTETVDLRTEALDPDDLAIRNTSGRTAALTHWSFGQLATIASAPPSYLRTLPAPIAAEAINYGLWQFARDQYHLFIERTAPWTVHAITSPRYARVQHHELASRVLDLMAQHPAWHLPLGYKDGECGAERVPSGAYLGDRDMFLFLVDGNRDLDDPTDRTHAGLFRGFILRNSDVGAAALTLDVFLFRMVCGNHIIWGFQHVAGFRRRHIGSSIQDAWTTSLDGVRAALDDDTASDRTLLLRATAQELGPTRDAVLETAVRRTEVSQKQAAEAYTLAEEHETNPRSIWGFVQGLTRLSQRTPWQDGRFVLDRAASRLLTTVH